MSADFSVVLDACVLANYGVANLLLLLAESGVARWKTTSSTSASSYPGSLPACWMSWTREKP